MHQILSMKGKDLSVMPEILNEVMMSVKKKKLWRIWTQSVRIPRATLSVFSKIFDTRKKFLPVWQLKNEFPRTASVR